MPRRAADVPAAIHAVLRKGVRELPEEYRPPEWLTDSSPRKTPYFPQIGDELVYFPQGYDHYLSEVRKRKVYDVKSNTLTRHTRTDLPRVRLKTCLCL